MKIILIADVKKVGRKGEVKEVADGYGQNVLIPRKLAVPGTAENLKRYSKEVARKEDKKAFDQTLFKKTLSDIDGKEIVLEAKSNESGTLFKSINQSDVARALEKQLGVTIPTSLITEIHIKKTGRYDVVLTKEGGNITLVVQ